MFRNNPRQISPNRGRGRYKNASRGRGNMTGSKFSKYPMDNDSLERRKYGPPSRARNNRLKNAPFQPENFDAGSSYIDNRDSSQGVPQSAFTNASGSDHGKWSQFSDIIIFFSGDKRDVGINVVKRSFSTSPHGPLSVDVKKSGPYLQVRLSCEGVCLAEGVSVKKSDAELHATQELLANLREHNYFIEAKNSYYPRNKKHFPAHVLNVDPNLSHIYKVVCLRRQDVSPFPHFLEGAVHYVTSMQELHYYVADHGRSSSNADLYILGIEKPDRQRIAEICAKHDLQSRPLLACSDRGMVAFRKYNVKEIFEELKRCGGETIKYILIPPGCSKQEVIKKEEIDDDEEVNTDDRVTQGGPPVVGPPSSLGPQSSLLEPRPTLQQGEDIKISPWISHALIIMEVFNRDSLLDSAKEILYCSVRDSPDLEEFIIEKKMDKYTGLITAEALIDKTLVGRAQGSKKVDVNDMAARDALKNLRASCYFIQCKRSYFGFHGEVPLFLKNGKFTSNLYKVVQRNQASSEGDLSKVLNQFKTSKVEDLFFLDDYSQLEKEFIYNMAIQMNMNVRRFGQKCVCVFKRKKPREIFRELMNAGIEENEKYQLLLPGKLHQEDDTNGQSNRPVETKLKSIFDYSKQDIALQPQSLTQRSAVRPAQSFQSQHNQPVDMMNTSFDYSQRDAELQSNSSTQCLSARQDQSFSIRDRSDGQKQSPAIADYWQGGNEARKRAHDAGPGSNEQGPSINWKQLKLQNEKNTQGQSQNWMQNLCVEGQNDPLQQPGASANNIMNSRFSSGRADQTFRNMQHQAVADVWQGGNEAHKRAYGTGPGNNEQGPSPNWKQFKLQNDSQTSRNMQPQASSVSDFRSFADSITDFVGSFKIPINGSSFEQRPKSSITKYDPSPRPITYHQDSRPSNTTSWDGPRQSNTSFQYGSKSLNKSSQHGSRPSDMSSQNDYYTKPSNTNTSSKYRSKNESAQYGSKPSNTSSQYGSRSSNMNYRSQYGSGTSNTRSQNVPKPSNNRSGYVSKPSNKSSEYEQRRSNVRSQNKRGRRLSNINSEYESRESNTRAGSSSSGNAVPISNVGRTAIRDMFDFS